MGAVYLILMALHVVGVFLNVRLLVSCFRYKEKFQGIFQNGNAVVIFQSILHLILLALNADDAIKAFSNQQQLEWCNINGVLIISVGFVLVYNMVAMIAMEYPSVFCLKQALSARTAMFGTLIASINTVGVLFWTGFFTLERLCDSQIASTMACSLLLLLMIAIVWRICRAEEHTTSREEIKESTDHIIDLLRADRTSAFAAICFLMLVTLTLGLPAIRYVLNLQEEHLEAVIFCEKVVYLFAMCFGVGIALPIISEKVIVFSVYEG